MVAIHTLIDSNTFHPQSQETLRARQRFSGSNKARITRRSSPRTHSTRSVSTKLFEFYRTQSYIIVHNRTRTPVSCTYVQKVTLTNTQTQVHCDFRFSAIPLKYETVEQQADNPNYKHFSYPFRIAFDESAVHFAILKYTNRHPQPLCHPLSTLTPLSPPSLSSYTPLGQKYF